MSDPEVVVRLLAAIDERERRYAEQARDWREGKSEDELHQMSAHPAYEYAMTQGQRKAWDDVDIPPEGDGWELNVTSVDPDAWARFDYHEVRYWRRLNPHGPDVWQPPAEAADALRLCQAHRDIVAEHSPREIASLEHDTWGQTFTVCRTCCVDGRRVVFPCPTLKITARGYGVEDGETK